MKIKNCLISLLCLSAFAATTQTVLAEVKPSERAAVSYPFKFSTSEATTNETKHSQSTYGIVRLDSINAGGKVTMKIRNTSGTTLSQKTAAMSQGQKYAMTYNGSYATGYWGHKVHGYLESASSSATTKSGSVYWAPDAW